MNPLLHCTVARNRHYWRNTRECRHRRCGHLPIGSHCCRSTRSCRQCLSKRYTWLALLKPRLTNTVMIARATAIVSAALVNVITGWIVVKTNWIRLVPAEWLMWAKLENVIDAAVLFANATEAAHAVHASVVCPRWTDTVAGNGEKRVAARIVGALVNVDTFTIALLEPVVASLRSYMCQLASSVHRRSRLS